MSYISQSGAEFLERSNATRLEDNRKKLEGLKKLLESGSSFNGLIQKEINSVTSLIKRAEAWIEKNGEPKPILNWYKVFRPTEDGSTEWRIFLDEIKAHVWGREVGEYQVYLRKELIFNSNSND